ncbi:AMP-binding protein [Ureibacillus sp. FSL K6-8385]|uniref:AMP-binding protein n=1 Tax=Ureibacillus terrenus TaxID=118246 RepID=A0A540V211_9BACL|nr:AMP-binding protein [Ureibacillus terrenus]MED3662408.1 AMP-binding protein [Ureibacillus terrenus]MED3763765.1 AMP-binding protein [Ureibacillus terrenus]TQE90253.1 AMP-binding protein [Ureibacillus terrenus]
MTTVFELLEKASEKYPDKEAVFDGANRVTYRQLIEEARLIAAALAQKGYQKGDRVMVSLPNWYEGVAIYFALARLGAILIPCNTRYSREELLYILENSGAKGMFVGKDFQYFDTFEQYLKSRNEDHHLEDIITVRSKKSEYSSYSDLLKKGRGYPVPSPSITPSEDVYTILYTSGTTGRPKGAMLTHENVVYSATITVDALKCSKDDVYLIPVPIFHVFGLVPGILSVVLKGSKMVFLEEYKAINALRLIESEKVTVHYGVPTMFILELNHPEFHKFDLSSLRTGIIAAAPCPEEIVRKIRTEMGCDIQVSYGLTETSAPITFTSFEDDDYLKSTTVGKFLPGYDGKIVDAQRQKVGIGEIGEIAVKGKGVMKGYYKMPEYTQAAFDDDGYFYTGDLGTMDEQGYVRIVGRKKEMIIRGGYNIYPREIEEHFYKHPSILEVAIIGLPDTVLGEISCAVIKLKPGHEEDEQSLKEYIKDKVADFKVPDRIIFVDKLPITASGKIIKHELKNIITEKLKATLR